MCIRDRFNEKKFSDSIERFQESFSLNPNSNETAEYLKVAQTELQKQDAAKVAARTARTTRVTTTTTTVAPTTTHEVAPPVPAAPSSLTTVFNHPFTDGRIVVRAGGDIVANEQLFTTRKRMFRTVPVPRPVSVTQQFPPKNADLEIWVSVPSKKIDEHKVISAVRFQPGAAHRLTVHYDQASNSLSYELN